MQRLAARDRGRNRRRAPTGCRPAPSRADTRRTAPDAICRRSRATSPVAATANSVLRGRSCSSKRTAPTSTGPPFPAAAIAARALASNRNGLAVSGQTTTVRTGAGRSHALVGQTEVALEHAVAQRGVPFLPLRNVALHQHHVQRLIGRQRARPSGRPRSRSRRPGCRSTPRGLARRSNGAQASTTVAKVRPCTDTRAAGCIMMSPSRPGTAQTLPSGFQGNPVATNCRARSPSTQAPASAST